MYTGPVPCSISNAQKIKANEVWDLIDSDSDTGGVRTFSVPLSPSGNTPTAWGTSTMLERECYDALKGTDNGDGTYTELTNAEFSAFLEARSAKLGRPVPASANSFRPQFKIGAEHQDFDAFLAEQGLQRVLTE